MKRTPSPALIISILALFVALSGSAYAAVKINGKNIKKGTVTTKQIKNGTITKSDLSKKLSVAGPTGPAGKDGTSALDLTLPSGKTMTGNWAISEANGGPAQTTFHSAIEFPAKTPAPLTSAEVNFKSTGATADDEDASCTGTSGSPTAPPGKVCIYASYQSYSNNPPSLTGISATLADRGFVIALAVTNGQSFSGYGSWAYTAP